VDLDVPPQEGAIGYYHPIAHAAVVPDVSVCHNKIVRPYSSFLLDTGRTMDGYMFTKDIVITNNQRGGGAVVLQVLGSIPNDSPGKDLVVFADGGFTGDIRMRSDGTVRPYFYTRVDYGVGPDGNRRI
jgi:hypothetical protein